MDNELQKYKKDINNVNIISNIVNQILNTNITSIIKIYLTPHKPKLFIFELYRRFHPYSYLTRSYNAVLSEMMYEKYYRLYYKQLYENSIKSLLSKVLECNT